MDYWDPAVTDGLARNREVILFNNAGVSSSAGKVPTSFHEMGANAVAFIKALGLSKVDVLGFSIGGMVAQEIAARGRISSAGSFSRGLPLDHRRYHPCRWRIQALSVRPKG
jgi:pimeloyl-ACP methyl ester carboxylesterase